MLSIIAAIIVHDHLPLRPVTMVGYGQILKYENQPRRVRTTRNHCRFLVTSKWLGSCYLPLAPPLPQRFVAISI